MMGFEYATRQLWRGRRLSTDHIYSLLLKALSSDKHGRDACQLIISLWEQISEPDSRQAIGRALRTFHFRELSIPYEGTVSVAGSGGAVLKPYNVSTAAALIAASAGCRILKSGSRGVTRAVGCVDLLQALGFELDVPLERIEESFADTGFAFAETSRLFEWKARQDRLLAHATDREARERIRQVLGAGAEAVGLADVYTELRFRGTMRVTSSGLPAPIRALHVRRGLSCCGCDGAGRPLMDEVSISGRTMVWEGVPGGGSFYEVHPADFGIEQVCPSRLQAGQSLIAQRDLFLDVLRGSAPRAFCSLALACAALLIRFAGLVETLQDGMSQCGKLLHSGDVFALLMRVKSHYRR
jgi:anthranilate phosphoribosyltransferase